MFSPFILSLILTPAVLYLVLSYTGSRLAAAVISLAVGLSILFIGNIYLYRKLRRR